MSWLMACMCAPLNSMNEDGHVQHRQYGVGIETSHWRYSHRWGTPGCLIFMH